MASRQFLLQRICIYARETMDPDSDAQVEVVLRRRFNVHLPQRKTMDERLLAAISDHEIIKLILQYRAAKD